MLGQHIPRWNRGFLEKLGRLGRCREIEKKHRKINSLNETQTGPALGSGSGSGWVAHPRPYRARVRARMESAGIVTNRVRSVLSSGRSSVAGEIAP